MQFIFKIEIRQAPGRKQILKINTNAQQSAFKKPQTVLLKFNYFNISS